MPKKTDELALTIGDNVPAVPDAQGTTLGAVALAIERGVEPSYLRELLQIKRECEADEARKAYAVAMAEAQSQMPVVVMDATNPSTHSRYARKETVEVKVKPIYLRHGFTVTFAEGPIEREGWIRVVARVRHIAGHEEMYERYAPADTVGPKGNPTKSPLHGCQSTVSYISRCLLCSIFNVTVAGEDADGADTAVVTQDQADELRGIADGMGGDTAARFLRWIGVEHFKDIPASRYADAKVKLQSKAAQ